MRIYHNQLSNTLNQGFKPVWLVFGDEPWQKNNSLTTIKQHCQQQGFSEVIRFSADDKFDWNLLVEEYQAMSLFSAQRIIEIELVTGKIADAGSKILLKLSENFHPDVQLIFHGPKIDSAGQKRKWFKSLEQLGCFVPLYDIEGRQLQQWLNQQIKQHKLNIHHDVTPLMIELFEGNLPALEQELQKFSLLFGTQLIIAEDAEKLLIKQAKFNPFQVVDTLLSGDLPKCIGMLDQLQHEGAAIGQLIWFIHKEITQLSTMLEQIEQGESIDSIYKKHRIWDKKKPLYQYALNHISRDNIYQAQARLAQTDLISKTSSDFNHFILLADVCISLYHGQTTKKFNLDYEFG
ncbi:MULTISPECIES: DNA polymerase III subunit delta [unclassified Colwellia]|uniref:DNA polymerase III subunit delta n=1 Tax=unclassified Colwellia TaxID=196834 RepID=UPI0015F71A00|nr:MULTISPECIES: DNA polymerase III subunit delta [unclassified Colwellia]MBA6355580.1 DNA polymerase III subunit delta [Colwellia sp. BRX8-3]MBA6360469.1 DNA polymerase III subunit delta [Colwellia sp. BRX8-6]MBA6367795.1 DNA polymerase III subunit delta [Colwellia sp. BRX8-5]MBA6374704.1 DNA polymerase III subunit delta [Colwellia sp. BRX8-2]